MPGSGKSTVGVLLAKALGYDFLDTDLIIQKNEKKQLQDLVDTLGVERFLDLEAAAIAAINCKGHIISPGGSVVCRTQGIDHLKSLGLVVYLSVPLDALKERITNLSTRGIAMTPDQTLGDVMDYRAPLYEKYADIIVPTKITDTPEDMVYAVERALKQYDPT